MTPIHVRLLGPVDLEVDGVSSVLQAKPLTVLAVLAQRSRRSISVEELLEEVWGPRRPETAVSSLRNCITTVRRTLRPYAEITAVPGGYRLEPADGTDLSVDTDTLAALCEQVDAAMNAGRYDTADATIASALALWRADPLTGVTGPWAERERGRLRQTHTGLRRSALEVAVHNGRHREVLGDLELLVAAEPHNERLHGLLMTALYRDGQRVGALATYRRARQRLNADVGIEPGPALTQLFQAILADTEPAASLLTPTSARIPKPAQLPAATMDFVGRDQLLAELVRRCSAPATVASISGMGGIGKTTLAVQVAHQLRERFPDGQLYVDLQGADPVPRAPSQVLGGFLRALGIGNADIPDDLGERAALFRSAMSERAMLVVLDNAADLAQVSPLLPSGPACAVLITSRSPIGVPAATAIRLPVLSVNESVALFTHIVGAERASSEAEAVLRIVTLCGALPMAIRIIAARIHSRPHWTIASEAERLCAEREDLRYFQVGDVALAAAFRSGFELLDAETARAFRLLADAEVPRLALPAVATVLDRDLRRAETLCELLVDRGMLESDGRERYRYHDLMRIFARSCPNPDNSDALLRLLDFTLATTKNFLDVRRHGQVLVSLLAATTSAGEPVTSYLHSEGILDAERRNYVALYRLAVDRGGPEHRVIAADLAVGVAETFSATGPTVDLAGALTALVDKLDADHAVEAKMRARMALAFALINESGDMPRGLATLQRARADMREDAHLHWIANAHGLSGIAAIRDRDMPRAIDELSTARAMFRRAGDIAGVRRMWCMKAVLFANCGDRHAALAAAARAVSLTTPEDGDAMIEVLARGAAGSALCRDGLISDGLAVLDEARRIAERNGTRRCESIIYGHLAEAHRLAGDPAEASRCAKLVVEARGADWEQDFLIHRAELLAAQNALRTAEYPAEPVLAERAP